jgi:hypothetical protein
MMLDPIERHDLQRENEDLEDAIFDVEEAIQDIFRKKPLEVTLQDILTLWSYNENLQGLKDSR